MTVVGLLADVATILGFLFVVLGAVFFRERLRRTYLAWLRWRHLRRGLAQIGIAPGRRALWRASLIREKNRATSETEPGLEEEIAWLWLLAGKGEHPLFMARERHGRDALLAISRAYEDLAEARAASLLVRLGKSGTQEWRLEQGMSHLMRSLAVYEPIARDPTVRIDLDPDRWFAIRWSRGTTDATPRGFLDDVVVSNLRVRLAPDSAPAAHFPEPDLRVPLPMTPKRSRRLNDMNAITKTDDATDPPMLYDGILPSLMDGRVERDPRRGLMRLHLCLSETTYSAVRLSHYRSNAADGWADVDGAAQLLTLSLLFQTRTGEVVLVERAEGVVHGGLLAPTINGNLDLYAPDGTPDDRDALGVPDPLLALLREGTEELGVDPSRVLHPRPLGVAQIGTEEERFTNVLFYVALFDGTAEDLAAGLYRADPVRGAWEVGSSLVVLPVDSLAEESVQSWFMSTADLTVHAVTSLYLLTQALTGAEPVQAGPAVRPASCRTIALPRWNTSGLG